MWRKSLATGKPMPLDPEPHPQGNILFNSADGFTVLASMEQRELAKARGAKLYMSHLATCPQRDAHRNPRG